MSQRQREADGFGNIASNEEFLEGMAILLYLQRVCLLVKRWQRGHYVWPPEHVRSVWLHCVNNHFVKDAIFVQAVVALHSVDLNPLRTVRVMSCYLHDCVDTVSPCWKVSPIVTNAGRINIRLPACTCRYMCVFLMRTLILLTLSSCVGKCESMWWLVLGCLVS